MTMKSVDPAHLRSVVLAGHAGGGKTTLAEQLLFQAGAVQRLGRVDDGTAHLDYEPEEQKRKESLSLAVATFEHDATRITLVDTPGYPDFVAEVVEGFAAADGALFVVDASAGVEAGLETAVALGPLDRSGRLLLPEQVRPRERRPDARRSTPCGRPSATRSRRSTSRSARPRRSAATSTSSIARPGGSSGKEVEIPVPDELADEIARRRDQLLEAAAEADDDVMAKYLDGEEISDAELDACLHRGVRDSILAPVLVGSAAKGIGMNALLDAFIRYLPTAAEEPPVRGEEREDRPAESRSRRIRPARSSPACSRPPPTRSSGG